MVFYENADQPFLLYQFYLEDFSRDLFNNPKKKSLILFRGYLDNFRNRQKYPTSTMFQEKVSEIFCRLSADLVFECVCFFNDAVNSDVIYYIFSTCKRNRDCYSPNLDIVAE